MSLFDYILNIDLNLAQAILYLRLPFWDQFFWRFTYLGHWLIILLIALIFSIFFYLKQKKYLIIPLFVSVLGSGAMTLIIKYLVDRARPGADIALYTESLASFPSAHAALIFSLLGFLAYCLWRSRFNLLLKIIFTTIFGAVIILVGFSRLYLGVHFASDVLAGYLVGLLWVLLVMYFSRRYFK
ncbi:MAG: phosphatase PAP2 family protein [Candidatus Paceibacterota bacterium]